jgi:hypothetical protein
MSTEEASQLIYPRIEAMWLARFYPRKKWMGVHPNVADPRYYKGLAAAHVHIWLIEQGYDEYGAEEIIHKWMRRGVSPNFMWDHIDKTPDAFFRAVAERASDLGQVALLHTHFTYYAGALVLVAFLFGVGSMRRWIELFVLVPYTAAMLWAATRYR